MTGRSWWGQHNTVADALFNYVYPCRALLTPGIVNVCPFASCKRCVWCLLLLVFTVGARPSAVACCQKPTAVLCEVDGMLYTHLQLIKLPLCILCIHSCAVRSRALLQPRNSSQTTHPAVHLQARTIHDSIWTFAFGVVERRARQTQQYGSPSTTSLHVLSSDSLCSGTRL